MRARKQNERLWTEHYQYLVAVSSSANFPDSFVLQYICEGATTKVKRAMQTRLYRRFIRPSDTSKLHIDSELSRLLF